MSRSRSAVDWSLRLFVGTIVLNVLINRYGFAMLSSAEVHMRSNVVFPHRTEVPVAHNNSDSDSNKSSDIVKASFVTASEASVYLDQSLKKNLGSNYNEDSAHFLFSGHATVYGTCNENNLYHAASRVIEGYPYIISSDFGRDPRPFIIHLCISKHNHYHTINLKFLNNVKKRCSAVLSATVKNPDLMHWDWRLKEEKILSIHTYSREFLNDLSGSMVISVSSTMKCNCTLEINVEEYPNDLLVGKYGMRGKSFFFYTDANSNKGFFSL